MMMTPPRGARSRWRSVVIGVLLTVVAVSGVSVRAEAQVRTALSAMLIPLETRPAVVTPREVSFWFPRSFNHEPNVDGDLVGHFVWGVVVDGAERFALVAGPSEAVRVSRMGGARGESTVRYCGILPKENAIPAALPRLSSCDLPLKGSLESSDGGIVIRVRDQKLIKQIMRLRPARYTRWIVEPGGRFRLELMEVWYVEDD